MPSINVSSLFVYLLGATALTGCTVGPQSTWTDLGPGGIATKRGQIACYTDANIIDGKRVEGTLCALPTSGFLSDGEPTIIARMGYGQKYTLEFSKTLAGFELPLDDKKGVLKCDPMKTEPGRTMPESFCTLTVNGQKLVSSKILFGGM
ncbi:hypothetical protein A584_04755 [Pseudomonas syringae pv. theae ICMP 3923]|nr:hypothetical protein A584_04755 [Pseudomonas syringae pv. theae ICMP 3923]KPZ30844.1 hypothetical protein AN901_203228 [Pseudomonas syringae pv. theae]MBL3831111.1 hypothetical protein [Pseudomonas syringae pv. theae]MBL3833164.1 hypothetical protein [Pseudomonas syringae pv. theae]MBL3870475.1 hypothetical protein [Pseudomonas syringae pv. theae]